MSKRSGFHHMCSDDNQIAVKILSGDGYEESPETVMVEYALESAGFLDHRRDASLSWCKRYPTHDGARLLAELLHANGISDHAENTLLSKFAAAMTKLRNPECV